MPKIKRFTMNMLGKNKVVGTKQVLKTVNSGTKCRVYLALDTDSFLKDRISTACEENGITPITVQTMAELGKACGIAVRCAVAAELL